MRAWASKTRVACFRKTTAATLTARNTVTKRYFRRHAARRISVTSICRSHRLGRREVLPILPAVTPSRGTHERRAFGNGSGELSLRRAKSRLRGLYTLHAANVPRGVG